MTRLLAILLLTACAVLQPEGGDPSARGSEPDFYLLIGIGDASPTNPGAVTNKLREDGGWPGFVSKTLIPQLEWATSEGHTVGVVLNRPFGHWRPGFTNHKGEHSDQLEIDSYDWAKASGQPWIYTNFVEALKPVCAKHRVWAYVGNVAGHDELKSLTPANMATMIRRNCQPFEDAGCYGVIVDTGALAITSPHYNAKGLVRPNTVESFTLLTIDRMKFAPTAVEPIPPNHAAYKELAKRDCFVDENVFAMYHKRTPAEDTAQNDGWSPDTTYIKGRVHRWIQPGQLPTGGADVDRVLRRCREVVAAGHVPCVPPYLMAGNCSPSDIAPLRVKLSATVTSYKCR